MTTSRNKQPIAIAGGGIGGLACALALARQGFRSLVLEQAREFGEVGVGLHVAPNALSVLDALGVGAAAKKNALMIERLLMIDGVTGEEVANIPCDERFERRFGNPYAVAHRAHIHGALLDACRAHELIELRTACPRDRISGPTDAGVVGDDGGRLGSADRRAGADRRRRRQFRSCERTSSATAIRRSAGAVIFRATIPADRDAEGTAACPTRRSGPAPTGT